MAPPTPLGSSRRALLAAILASTACRSRSSEATTRKSRFSDPAARAKASANEGPPPMGPDDRLSFSTPSVRVSYLRFDANAPTPVATVLAPESPPQGRRLPVVIAFHGRGESVKIPDEGALGWPRDYGLVRCYERLLAPPLVTEDYMGFVTAEVLTERNRSLSKTPFGAPLVVCPFVPEADLRDFGKARRFGAFVREVLLPRLGLATQGAADPNRLGIDGISLGGAFALRVGLLHPTLFRAVSGLQPALPPAPSSEWVSLARAARAQNPSLHLRLLTSEEDGFRSSIEQCSEALTSAGVPHDFARFPGPHDYIFNRGPASMELLFWHDRRLGRTDPPPLP